MRIFLLKLVCYNEPINFNMTQPYCLTPGNRLTKSYRRAIALWPFMLFISISSRSASKRILQGLPPTLGNCKDNPDTLALNASTLQAKKRSCKEALLHQVNTKDITFNNYSAFFERIL